MADPRFFDNHGPFTLAHLAHLSSAELADPRHGDRLIRDIQSLDRAGADELSFLDNAKYLESFRASAAGACVVAPRHRGAAPDGMALLVSARPYLAYARIAQAFYPLPPLRPGIAPSAVVAADARIGEGSELGANVVVAGGATIGRRCLLEANVVVGPAVVVGDDCRLQAGAVVTHAILGDRVALLPGAKLGQDGFGFAIDPAGHVRVPQVGLVRIGDDCVIGANSTIDRGHLKDTVVGAGCWIDNLVQIGHNVELGSGCIIVAQTGISGSTRLGDLVAAGGQAGLTGHLTIGDGAQIAAQAGVMTDVPAGARVAGSPAQPARAYFRQQAAVRRLAQRRGAKA